MQSTPWNRHSAIDAVQSSSAVARLSGDRVERVRLLQQVPVLERPDDSHSSSAHKVFGDETIEIFLTSRVAGDRTMITHDPQVVGGNRDVELASTRSASLLACRPDTGSPHSEAGH